MKAQFTTLAQFEAQAAQLATAMRDMLYYEADTDGTTVWVAADLWECLLSDCEFQGLRPVRKADMEAAKVLFLPYAEAALAAIPQIVVGGLVSLLTDAAAKPAQVVAQDYALFTVQQDGKEWEEHARNLWPVVAQAA